MHLVARQPIDCAKAGHLRPQAPLLGFQPLALALATGQVDQELLDQRRDGGGALGGHDAGAAICFVIK